MSAANLSVHGNAAEKPKVAGKNIGESQGNRTEIQGTAFSLFKLLELGRTMLAQLP